VRWAKNKKYWDGLNVDSGLVNISVFCPFTMVYLSIYCTLFLFSTLGGNVRWYGVVREYEAVSYQFTSTFFTSHKPSQNTETRMHYTICWAVVNYFYIMSLIYLFFQCEPHNNHLKSTHFYFLVG